MSSFLRLSSLDAVPPSLRGAYVAIGNFDGFHRGHQSVFDLLRRRAAEAGVPAIVLTFEPHPRDVFAPEPLHVPADRRQCQGTPGRGARP